MVMNNGFTQPAQEALRQAHGIVQQKRHNQLDVEHIMLALLRPPNGLVCKIIETLDGDPRQLQECLDDALSAGPQMGSGGAGPGMMNIHISMRAQRVVSESASEAAQLGDSYIGVEHLFLAIAGERGGSTARLLSEMNINRERVYQALQENRRPASSGTGFNGEPLDVSDPYQRMLLRVIRLQDELAELRRDLESAITQHQSA